MTPLISVVIPTFNRRETLGTVLPLLAKQTLPPDQYELLLCDSGSTDGTRELVAELAIANLRQAIDEDSHKDLHSYAVHDQEVERRDKENLEAKHPLIEGVNLSQRAYPLLKMFESAQQHGDDVVWSGGSAW